MNSKLKKALLFVTLFLMLTPFASAGILEDFGSGVSNFFGGVASTVSNVVNDFIVQPVSNFFSGISSFFGGLINAVTGGGTTPAPSPDAGTSGAPSGYNQMNGTGDGDEVGGGNSDIYSDTDGDIPVYIKNNIRTTNIKEVGFSQLELSNLYIETLLKNDEVVSGIYVNIFNELSNIGSKSGNTKFRTEIDCIHADDLTGNYQANYETEIRTEWKYTGDLDPGSVSSMVTIWFVPKEKYIYGGKCKITTEIADNVRRTNIVENVLCRVYYWATGDSTEDCSTTSTDKEEIVETRGETKLEKEFVIMPRVPKLKGTLSQDFDPFGFE